MVSNPYITILISLLFSAFFSGVEIAFVSSNKLKIELEKKQGNLTARIYSSFINAPARFITTMLLGNNIALVVFGIAMGQLLEPPIREWVSNAGLVLFIQTIISTLTILVTAEFLPKVLFAINPNRSLNVFEVPIVLIYYVLAPVVFLVNSLTDLILRFVLRVPKSEQPALFGLVDLNHMVREMTETADESEEIENEIQIFQNALDFSQVKARECMIPRTEMVACEVEDSLDELRAAFVKTGLSKIVVYRDNIDNVIGYVHSSELFKKPESIKNILLPISIVPEAMAASHVLELLLGQKRSMAIVVDEFGGTSGLLTMEDVVEEIFGEIEDEHDREVLTEIQLEDGSYRFAARLEVEYINETHRLDLPELEEYETLAGLIIYHHESIPEQGEVIEVDGYRIKVLQVSDKKVDLVELSSDERD